MIKDDIEDMKEKCKEKFITATELAKIMCIHPATLRRRCYKGKFLKPFVDSIGRYSWLRSEVEDYLNHEHQKILESWSRVNKKGE